MCRFFRGHYAEAQPLHLLENLLSGYLSFPLQIINQYLRWEAILGPALPMHQLIQSDHPDHCLA